MTHSRLGGNRGDKSESHRRLKGDTVKTTMTHTSVTAAESKSKSRNNNHSCVRSRNTSCNYYAGLSVAYRRSY